MFFALAVLLIQPQVHAQMDFPAEKIALIQPTNSSPASLISFSEISLPLTPAFSIVSIQPAGVSDSTDLPIAPEPAPVKDPTLNAFLRSGKPMTVYASLYAAIQVGPLMMDYVGRKMLYSRHSWVRHMWWVPQSASFASSLFCGVHNLGVH